LYALCVDRLWLTTGGGGGGGGQDIDIIVTKGELHKIRKRILQRREAANDTNHRTILA
jgi:hypothetical protein